MAGWSAGKPTREFHGVASGLCLSACVHVKRGGVCDPVPVSTVGEISVAGSYCRNKGRMGDLGVFWISHVCAFSVDREGKRVGLEL